MGAGRATFITLTRGIIPGTENLGEHTHCLHYEGDCLTVNPPLYTKVCCHCGGYVRERDKSHNPSSGPHGPYAERLPLRYRR